MKSTINLQWIEIHRSIISRPYGTLIAKGKKISRASGLADFIFKSTLQKDIDLHKGFQIHLKQLCILS